MLYNFIKRLIQKSTQHTLSRQAPPPPRLSRSGAFIELPALNAPFRDNRGGGAYLERVCPSTLPSRSHPVPTTPPFETSLLTTCSRSHHTTCTYTRTHNDTHTHTHTYTHTHTHTHTHTLTHTHIVIKPKALSAPPPPLPATWKIVATPVVPFRPPGKDWLCVFNAYFINPIHFAQIKMFHIISLSFLFRLSFPHHL